MLSVLALLGCTNPTTPVDPVDDDCPIGAEGCACTQGGACDAGLACLDATCVTDDVDTDDTDQPVGEVATATWSVGPGVYDLALDTERHQLFLSYGSGTVDVLDLTDGEVTTVTTGHRAEHLFFDAVRDEVVVSLPVQDHSSYWYDDEQEGYVAAIDATTLADPTPVWIDLDPYDIVSDGTGTVYATGGSGQWTDTIAVDLSTGFSQKGSGSARQGSKLAIHPDLDRVYAADNGLSPSDIERWNLASGAITYAYDSPYHGDYPMCGDLRVHPGGDTVYTRCGHLFLASNNSDQDLTWLGDLGETWVDLGFHPDGDRVLFVQDGSPILYVYDNATLSAKTTVPLGANPSRIAVGPTYLVVLTPVGGGAPGTEVAVTTWTDLGL